MDPLHVCIALGPVAMYLLVLGAINLSPRPVLTTGTRDIATLGIAISGFAIAGPMELFLPVRAVGFWGPWITWGLMLGIYVLGLLLVVLMLRPRLVIYNATLDQVLPVRLTCRVGKKAASGLVPVRVTRVEFLGRGNRVIKVVPPDEDEP